MLAKSLLESRPSVGRTLREPLEKKMLRGSRVGEQVYVDWSWKRPLAAWAASLLIPSSGKF